MCLDTNENVKNQKIRQKFLNVGLQEAITTRHGLLGPSSCEGETLLDGIFISPDVHIEQCGYTSGGIPSNHQLLWIDINEEQTFKNTTPPMALMTCRRLKLQDPRIVKRYNRRLKQYMEEHKVAKKLSELQQHISGTLTPAQEETYENLDQLIVEGKNYGREKMQEAV